ncbi:MAG: YitT family protein [Firmicutes bacterium]|nr:YitT family protein [Bacillota bacterium]
MNLFKKEKKDILKEIYKKDRLTRYTFFVLGVLIVAIAFNIFILPNDIVFGVSGVAVILKKLFGTDPSLVILIGSLILLVLSYILMGKEKTTNSVVGSVLYPVFVKLTEWLIPLVDLGTTEPFLIAIFGAAISGFGFGLIFKSGFTTGGTDILNQIVSKYFKMSIGNAMFFTDGLIIFASLFFFGWQKFMYSIVSICVISIMTDKVILGISQSKAFYIITDHETAVKKFITQELNYGVTILDARGGFTGNMQKVIMCIIPTKEYFKVKEGIHSIDPNSFFLVTDAYEVSGGVIKNNSM